MYIIYSIYKGNCSLFTNKKVYITGNTNNHGVCAAAVCLASGKTDQTHDSKRKQTKANAQDESNK